MVSREGFGMDHGRVSKTRLSLVIQLFICLLCHELFGVCVKILQREIAVSLIVSLCVKITTPLGLFNDIVCVFVLLKCLSTHFDPTLINPTSFNTVKGGGCTVDES